MGYVWGLRGYEGIDERFIYNMFWYWYQFGVVRMLYCSLLGRNIDFWRGLSL